MKGEYINILNYRAWAYLQLAQIYGTVLYYDEPITVDKVSDGVPMNIKELAQTLLEDPYQRLFDHLSIMKRPVED